jgi:hypothetical protein
MPSSANPAPQPDRGSPSTRAMQRRVVTKLPSEKLLLTRVRNTAIIALFALALLIPTIIHLRRSERSWFAFRIVLGMFGASLVLLPLALWGSYLLAVVGLAMFVGAILLPSARPDTTADEKARELGALVVVNGGEYQPGNAPSAPVRLFTGVENIWALDRHFQPLLVIPVRELTIAKAENHTGVWLLRLRWADHSADFTYRGIFAEHLARVAESTLHSVMRPALPVIPQRRAASA